MAKRRGCLGGWGRGIDSGCARLIARALSYVHRHHCPHEREEDLSYIGCCCAPQLICYAKAAVEEEGPE